jgi:hypothetical protein
MPRIKIGSQTFRTKNTAKNFFREIRDSKIDGDPITGDDRVSVESLLSLHPAAAEKIGCGVDAIVVLPDGRGGRCFYVRRTDGSLIDFSFHTCIDGRPPSFTRFSQSCRSAVANWMIAWRQQQLETSEQRELGLVKCSVTGEWLPLSATDADHIFPLTFSKIVNDFAILRGINIDTFDAYLHQGTENLRFEDQSLSDAFHAYHATVANLRMVKRIINQQTAFLGRQARQQECA